MTDTIVVTQTAVETIVVAGGQTITIPQERVDIVSVGTQGPAGVGVPAGGTTGQALVKTSGADFATAWQSIVGGVTSVFGRVGAIAAQVGDYAFSQISGALNLATQVSGILPDGNTVGYIRKDGTSVATASIPFAEGLSVAATKKMLIGGTSLSTARGGIYDDTANLYIKGYQDAAQTHGAHIVFQAGDGAVPDALGGMFRLHGGNSGTGGDLLQNGFVTTDQTITGFSLSNEINGAITSGNSVEDFLVGGAFYASSSAAFSAGIGLCGAVLCPTGYAALIEGNTARIIGMDRRLSGPGLNLTVQAGWAQVGSTNQAAGTLKLAPGKSTGSGTGGVDIQAVSGASGTADRTPFDVVQWRGATATFPVAYNFASSAGLSIGSKASDLISFYNVAPIVQPAATVDLGTVLSNLGLRAAGTAYPLTTTAAVSTGALTCTTITTGNGAVELYPSGTYTPTLTNTTNVAASTARLCNYIRIGNICTVAGQLDIDPTAPGAVLLGISLPIPSAFTTAFQLGGVASALAVAGESAGLRADATNDRASLEYVAVDTTNHTLTFNFQYEII